ncbi:O-fucosyltransferase 27 [Ancistrocladus abbreviatus]
MRFAAVKAEGKMLIKTKMKCFGLMGLFLSAFSLAIHFLLARYTQYGLSDYQSSVTIFSWRPIFENADLRPASSALYRRLWGPVPQFGSLHPFANPRGHYAAPSLQSTGFLFVRIQGGFHEIRTAICDAVVVARLLNASLVIPEILSATSTKGISSEFKSFAYLYNEDHFMVALAKDVNIVKMLPKNLKEARRKKAIPIFRVPHSASPYFYMHRVLPILKKHSVVELVVSDGGCLQAILPPGLEEYQRLRCRVAYHALSFRQGVQELAMKILNRLRTPQRPFIAYEPAMTREALAYHGCAELFQDVHTELIQHKRSWMIKRGIVKGKLSVNSAEQRLNGSCPLMPEEVGILLRAYGYPSDTIIYVSGGEVFGGQRLSIPLHAMFDNVVDRTLLSTGWELSKIYGREANLESGPPSAPSVVEEMKLDTWKTSGPRPRPLPPPPARPKSYNIEGWWGWVAESDNEPESTVMELRTNAHKLLWEAIDYYICTEADVFISGFDRDGKGHPNFAGLVMGHRLYQSAAYVTFRPDRKEVARLIDNFRDSLYQANRTWLSSVRRHLRETLLTGLVEASTKSKPLSFLSHPVPECSCSRKKSLATTLHASSPSHSSIKASLGVLHSCPTWMDGGFSSRLREETEEEMDEDENISSGVLFGHAVENHEVGSGDITSKEETQADDQDELEGSER